MNDSIRFSVVRDDDGTGLLSVRFASGPYSGNGSAHFDLKRLGCVAQELAVFPLSDRPVVIAGGFFDDTQEHSLVQEHVFLQIRAIAGGPVELLIRVADPWEVSNELRRSASAEFLLDYEQLRALSRKLQLLAQGDRDDIVLELDPAR